MFDGLNPRLGAKDAAQALCSDANPPLPVDISQRPWSRTQQRERVVIGDGSRGSGGQQQCGALLPAGRCEQQRGPLASPSRRSEDFWG